MLVWNCRNSRLEVFCKKVFLETPQNSQENTCARASFLIKLQAQACNLIKKEALAQVFSYEFCEISKNTFFQRTPLVAASGIGIFFIQSLVTQRVVYKEVLKEGALQARRNEKNSWGEREATNLEMSATMVGRRRKFLILNRLKGLEKFNICRRWVL